MRVDNALWLTRGTRGVDDEKGPVSLHRKRRLGCTESAPEIEITKRFQPGLVSHVETRRSCRSKDLGQRRVDTIERPAISALINDVLAGVAHNNDLLDDVLNGGKTAGDACADFSLALGCELERILERTTELAHDVAAL